MLKCKHEHCQYPNCDGENCGIPTENMLAIMCAENGMLRAKIQNIYSEVAHAPLRQALHKLSQMTAKEEEITCPFGYENCISDPAYIRRCHPEWWIELGRPTECSCHYSQQEADAMGGCPYYDDEDK